jgi:hypothetical protein
MKIRINFWEGISPPDYNILALPGKKFLRPMMIMSFDVAGYVTEIESIQIIANAVIFY